MVRKMVAVVLVASAMLVAACNTVRGMGEDVSSAANSTENAMNGR
ncbi:entericidin A/B family lipoprotein [Sphingomonas ginkgonis]|uniref:Entericidin A/B family lipoprotein n=1 Tax=Sphingomonas ginkgonis TaxID=2315330 RepID=A0A3R9WPY7_9SPHN|nr:entericidin A/B family lipoprotein [Sphingomonas ginkgonis]RST31589.1 entericidin A/B family lipoprotein [Sphingomonas ginkgonis]